MNKIGWGELLIVAILALVVFGPDKLPKLGRALGQAVHSVKKYIHEATKELEDLDELKNIKKDVEDIQKDVRDMGRSLEQTVSDDMAEAEKKLKETEADLKAAVTAEPAGPDAADKTENTETENTQSPAPAEAASQEETENG